MKIRMIFIGMTLIGMMVRMILVRMTLRMIFVRTMFVRMTLSGTRIIVVRMALGQADFHQNE